MKLNLNLFKFCLIFSLIIFTTNKAPPYHEPKHQINPSKPELIIINNTNLKQYIRFPSFIIEKFQKKEFSNTHFSDLLRLELLIKYGGTWIDASVLITKYNKLFFKNDLFFFRAIKITSDVGSSWFITSEKESPVLKTTRDLLYEYWRKENYLCIIIFFFISFLNFLI